MSAGIAYSHLSLSLYSTMPFTVYSECFAVLFVWGIFFVSNARVTANDGFELKADFLILSPSLSSYLFILPRIQFTYFQYVSLYVGWQEWQRWRR